MGNALLYAFSLTLQHLPIKNASRTKKQPQQQNLMFHPCHASTSSNSKDLMTSNHVPVPGALSAHGGTRPGNEPIG
jgi:hypothetical protein